MGKDAVEFEDRVGDITPDCGCNPKFARVDWAAVVSTNAEGEADVYSVSGMVISPEQRMRYDAAFAVPCVMSWCGRVAWMDGMESDCVGCAVWMQVWESSNGGLVVWALCEY